MTPRRVMTFKCSQMGRTLERTFNGPSPEKIPIEPRSIDGLVSPRKGPDYDQLRRGAQLRQRPPPALQPEPEEQRLPPQLGRPRHHIAARQLHEALPRFHLPNHRHVDPALLRRPQVPP